MYANTRAPALSPICHVLSLLHRMLCSRHTFADKQICTRVGGTATRPLNKAPQNTHKRQHKTQNPSHQIKKRITTRRNARQYNKIHNNTKQHTNTHDTCLIFSFSRSSSELSVSKNPSSLVYMISLFSFLFHHLTRLWIPNVRSACMGLQLRSAETLETAAKLKLKTNSGFQTEGNTVTVCAHDRIDSVC